MTERDFLARIRRLREAVERAIADHDATHRRRLPRRAFQNVLRSADPRLSSVLRAADDLQKTAGQLLGEPALGEADLQRLRDFVDFLIARFDLMGTHSAAERETRALAVSKEAFIELDFDYPRPHHVWIVRHADAAGGLGIEADRDTEMTEVLHSIRDVYNGQLRVIRVKGDSMSPVLHDGDKVTIDTRLVEPQDGDVVAVYDSVRGGIVGYWRRAEDGEFWLDKENGDSQRLERGGGWTLWGTVTRIVDTPVHPRRRPARG